ncbi:MAG: outer membrane lipoprotein carrier protein LolA [Saprospiraceae bacterium]|nr:outer membrane lipoprotein carrier protein LolA [Saprospiraceae bacterium]
MKKMILLPMILLLSAAGIFAQKPTNQFTKKGDNDPAAKAILDKVKKNYQSYKSLEATFNLEIELAEQAKEVQKGKIAQQGEKYFLDLGPQQVLCDGKAIWMVLPKNKEVQVNNMPSKEEEASILTPQALFRFYEKGGFIYALINEYTENGKVMQQIEFKPTDRNAEYSKIRLTVEKKTASVASIKAFSKDGSRYTFNITKLTPNKTFDAGYFTFNKAKYPGYHIEDLRE